MYKNKNSARACAWGRANREYKSEKQREYRKTPKYKYIAQREAAARRGINWEFTLETWEEVWKQSGRWEQRGHKRGQYCMCRKGDTGPYSVGNVLIKLTEDNKAEAYTNGTTWLAKKHGAVNEPT